MKTSFLKKGLARQKNLLAAKKKEAVSKNLQPSEELTTFLNDEATLGEIEKVKDKQDILVRRYDCLSLRLSLLVVVVGIVLVVVIVLVTSCVTLSTKRGCCQEHDSIRGCRCKIFHVISVWDHKTAASHGPAKIAIKNQSIYKLLVQYMGRKTGADLVFATTGGKRLTHIGL